MGSNSKTSIEVTNVLPTFAELDRGTWFYWAGEEINARNLKRKWEGNDFLEDIDGRMQALTLQCSDPKKEYNHHRSDRDMPWIASAVTVVDVEIKVFVNNT